jgi:hypothetical protein
MTKDQAAALRLRWEQQAYLIPCEHVTLELVQNDWGHSTDKYACILCGKVVAQSRLAA